MIEAREGCQRARGAVTAAQGARGRRRAVVRGLPFRHFRSLTKGVVRRHGDEDDDRRRGTGRGSCSTSRAVVGDELSVPRLRGLGIRVGATTIRSFLRRSGLGPAPSGSGPSWSEFRGVHQSARTQRSSPLGYRARRRRSSSRAAHPGAYRGRGRTRWGLSRVKILETPVGWSSISGGWGGQAS